MTDRGAQYGVVAGASGELDPTAACRAVLDDVADNLDIVAIQVLDESEPPSEDVIEQANSLAVRHAVTEVVHEPADVTLSD
ncbi:hypothetical protein D3C75_1144710 [compost metagenome]